MLWIGETFIPNSTMRSVLRNGEQTGPLWNVFQKWCTKTGHQFDLKEIDLAMFRGFRRALPSLGWSQSCIHLIEKAILAAREYLHRVKILYFPGLSLGEYSIDSVPPISVEDFRRCRGFVLETCNDFEIVLFDMISLESISDALSLKVRDFLFDSGHVFRMSSFSARADGRILPTEISSRLRRLIETRAICRSERIFDAIPRIWELLRRRLRRFCLESNLPCFFVGSFQGFVHKMIRHFRTIELYSAQEIDGILGGEICDFEEYQKRQGLVDRINSWIMQEVACPEPPYRPDAHLLQL